MRLITIALLTALLTGCASAWNIIGGAAASAREADSVTLEDGYARIERERCIDGVCGRVVEEYRVETLHPPDGDPIECVIECVEADIDLDLSLLPDGYDTMCWATKQSAHPEACDAEIQRLGKQ